MFTRIKNEILDILFPSVCLGCRAKGEVICNQCVGRLRTPDRECAKWIFPLFDYRDPVVRNAVWLLKYRGKKSIAHKIAELMQPMIAEELSELEIMENFGDTIVIPIPLSKSRLRERGYNQSTLIAKNLNGFETLTDVLIKTKDVEHQARIESRHKRIQNVVGSFGIKNTEKIKGRNVILIDDVTTTGATLTEARKVLIEGGARKVYAFTFAH